VIKHEDRAKLFADLETILRADLPWLPILYIPSVEGWRDTVKGWNAWAAGYARAWNVTVSR
jgi:ABC-type transport system substrate-binding protein